MYLLPIDVSLHKVAYYKTHYLNVYYYKARPEEPMNLNFTGIIIAVCAFLIIGAFHPIVIKTEYYTGTRFWWVFLAAGIVCLGAALFVENTIGSVLLGILGASLLWSIHELFEQKERVEKGWFPKRKDKRR